MRLSGKLYIVMDLRQEDLAKTNQDLFFKFSYHEITNVFQYWVSGIQNFNTDPFTSVHIPPPITP